MFHWLKFIQYPILPLIPQNIKIGIIIKEKFHHILRKNLCSLALNNLLTYIQIKIKITIFFKLKNKRKFYNFQVVNL